MFSGFRKLVGYTLAGYTALCAGSILNRKVQQMWVKKKHIKWYGEEYIGSVSFDESERDLLAGTIHKSPTCNSYVSFDQYGDISISTPEYYKCLYQNGNTYIFRMWDRFDEEQKTIFSEHLNDDGTLYKPVYTSPTGHMNF